MNILYISNLCSEKKFKRIFEICKNKPEQASQKFHYLLTLGLKKLFDNYSLNVMSTLPINRFRTKKIWFSPEKEIDKGILYIYLPLINLPVLKHFFNVIFTLIYYIIWSVKKKDKVIIIDALNLISCISTLFVSKIFRIKIVAIVTDLPQLFEYTIVKKSAKERIFYTLYKKLIGQIMGKFDAYIFLTEQMNQLVNKKNKPFLIIEGMVDSEMVEKTNPPKKYEEKVIIYAGALREKYGVKKLIDSFTKVENENARLWIYGLGELEEEIKKYERNDSRISFFGTVPNAQVVAEEIKASLLVNPRPSNEEFTKFSFPSKNMEYMVSGTPVLTTPLPGMPKEYYDYIYIFEDESVSGMTAQMEFLLNTDSQILVQKGLKAKKFVLEEKNNVIQAEKIVNLIKSEVL